MTQKKYPKEIYKYEGNGCEIAVPHLRTTLEKAYDCGFTNGRAKERLGALNPLVGWSNLTEAIEAGENIDWEALDGLEAKCVHRELGTLTHKLERDEDWDADRPGGWYNPRSPYIWGETFHRSWNKIDGWSIWVKGEIPLRKLTADKLEPGTCFKGQYSDHTPRIFIRYDIYGRQSLKTSMAAGIDPAHMLASEEVEVLETYGKNKNGTFPTPKEDA